MGGGWQYISLCDRFQVYLFKVHSISVLLELPLVVKMFKLLLLNTQYFKCIMIIKCIYKEEFCIFSFSKVCLIYSTPAHFLTYIAQLNKR